MKSTFLKSAALSLLLPLALVGCGTPPSPQQEEPTEQGAVQGVSSEAKTAVGKFLVQGSPTVLFYFAEWCGACSQFKPIVKEIEDKYPGVKVVRLNIDENQETATLLQVNSIPTLFFFDKSGQFVKTTTGVLDSSALSAEFDSLSKK